MSRKPLFFFVPYWLLVVMIIVGSFSLVFGIAMILTGAPLRAVSSVAIVLLAAGSAIELRKRRGSRVDGMKQ